MDTIVKFKEAAKELQKDELYLALAAARKAEEADEELQSMLGEFNLLKLDLNNEMQKMERDADKITTANARLSELYDAIMANENMVVYNKAKKDIEDFIEYVSEVLNVAIEGGDPMAVEWPKAAADCAPEACASCAGCG